MTYLVVHCCPSFFTAFAVIIWFLFLFGLLTVMISHVFCCLLLLSSAVFCCLLLSSAVFCSLLFLSLLLALDIPCSFLSVMYFIFVITCSHLYFSVSFISYLWDLCSVTFYFFIIVKAVTCCNLVIHLKYVTRFSHNAILQEMNNTAIFSS